jgi:DNA repair exonuclease SbcCD ATPase subunit
MSKDKETITVKQTTIDKLIDELADAKQENESLRAQLKQRNAVLDRVDTSTQRIEAGVDRAAAGSQQVAAELERLRTLIVDYATTSMPHEQFLALALGEQRAAEILKYAADRQAALADEWHNRLPSL